MKSGLLTALTIVVSQWLYAQNVGIGNTNPQHKLDVNGDVNVTGTIRANGTAGNAGQVLRTNNSGNLEWANACNYSNFVGFTAQNINWVVPAGVTKILVEAWGAGGGGNNMAGGGGGGYVKAHFTVSPGSAISGTLGAGGTGGSNAGSPGGSGGQTSVTVSGYTIYANGGTGASGTANLGMGGSFTVNPGYANIVGIHVGNATANQISYTYNGTNYFTNIIGGKGGDAANTLNTGGVGSYIHRLYPGGTDVLHTNPSTGQFPGGGGGAGNSFSNAGAGNNGYVIIHY